MKRFLALATLTWVSMSHVPSQGATIFESSTLGTTGVEWDDLLSQSVPGSNINPSTFNGVRFELTHHTFVTAVGGHFVASSSEPFFGAIVSLDDEHDLPDSVDLSTSDVLGHTEVAIPRMSDEVLGELRIGLSPGWYALVFGSGLFNTSAIGGVLRNGEDIGTPTYIANLAGTGWRSLEGTSLPFNNARYVIRGFVVPEPSTLTFLLIGLFATAGHGGRS